MKIVTQCFRLRRLLPLVAVGSIGIIAACSGSDPGEPGSSSASSTADLSDNADPGITCGANIDRFRELEIVHPSVMNSTRASNATDGPWSFRFLVEQMTPTGTTPSDFVLKMLRSWETDQTVNGVTVPARPNIDSDVINPWLTASGGSGTLDLSKAPFQLIAIVNRVDLLSPDCSSAGEGRFVFAVLDAAGQPQSFTMIFEYHLPVGANVTPHTWAQRWHKLHSLDVTLGDSGPFNAQLEKITNQFVLRGSLPGAPNDNAISQVRSNEIALGNPWQLREFHLVADKTGAGFLVPGTTAQSPTQAGLNDTAILHDYLSDNASAINDGTIKMKNKYTDTINGVKSTVSILGPNSDENGQRWQSTDPVTTRNPNPIDATTLTNFTFLTCNGCHNLENVQIGSFYHVDPFIQPGNPKNENSGSERLSPFLLGNGSIPSDLTRRATVMQGLLCQTTCPTTPLVQGPEAARVE